jgi:hypothetical protein
MEIPVQVQVEWATTHTLSVTSCRLLHDLGDPGDTHPISTGLDLLRAADRRVA